MKINTKRRNPKSGRRQWLAFPYFETLNSHIPTLKQWDWIENVFHPSFSLWYLVPMWVWFCLRKEWDRFYAYLIRSCPLIKFWYNLFNIFEKHIISGICLPQLTRYSESWYICFSFTFWKHIASFIIHDTWWISFKKKSTY
jgi:hypothetical protein